MWNLAHNETHDIKAYHSSFHTCPFFRVKAYMMSLMPSCVAICQLSNEQRVKDMLNTSNPCPRSHVKRLNVKDWIKLKRKHNTKVKVEYAMQNKQINGLTINHSPAPLHRLERMQVLNDQEMESFSKIYFKNVLWWMSIKNACNLKL